MAAAVNGRVAAAAAQGPAAPPLAPLPASAPPPTSSSNSNSFPSHLDAPPGSLDPRVVALCDILSNVPAEEVEPALSRSGIPPIASLVEPVLRLSYSRPAAAVRFFRWAALSTPHSPASWNLMVDLLGRNSLFEAMWDAIRSMRDEPSHPLSHSTFVSAFSSYCLAGRVKEAFMTFEVMDRYGVPPDPFVLNSLLSAACRAGQTPAAADFLDRARSRGVSPDADSYAILLEGWEREGDVASAKRTFGDMVVRLGWDPANTPAHDAFLSSLIRGREVPEALKFLQVMTSKGCLPSTKFFSNALDVLVRDKDLANASALWDAAVAAAGLAPNTVMYNAMIALRCDHRDAASALRLLDEMTLQRAFPDSLTYDTIFECLVKGKRAREADSFFHEMRKNEFPPSSANCVAAIRMFFDEYDPEAALEVWRCVLEENVAAKDECANEVLLGLRDLLRMTEVKKYAEEMLDMGIELYSSTLAKLRNGFSRAGKLDAYDRIERRAKVQK